MDTAWPPWVARSACSQSKFREGHLSISKRYKDKLQLMLSNATSWASILSLTKVLHKLKFKEEKSVWFFIWRAWVSVQDFMEIHLNVRYFSLVIVITMAPPSLFVQLHLTYLWPCSALEGSGGTESCLFFIIFAAQQTETEWGQVKRQDNRMP